MQSKKQPELLKIMKTRIFGMWIGKITSYKNFKEGSSETLGTL